MPNRKRYLVEMCADTGVECVWCTYSDCERRRQEWRASPWSNKGTSCRPGDEHVDDYSKAEPHVREYLF